MYKINYDKKENNLNKIISLCYTKKTNNFSFEELYRIAYNYVIYKININISYNESEYLKNIKFKHKYHSSYYLNIIYNILDSRICCFNNIQHICDVNMYATNIEEIDFKNYLHNLNNHKKYKQNCIILCLQKFNINQDVIKKILFVYLG